MSQIGWDAHENGRETGFFHDSKILEHGCEAIARRGLERVAIDNSINAMALHASGKEEYLPMLANYAKLAAELRIEAMATWHYSHALMFLAEYVIATGDQSVTPGLKRIALEAARAQSGGGTPTLIGMEDFVKNHTAER